MINYIKKDKGADGEQTMYERMIHNLSSNDWKSWDNYPHDNFSITSWKVEEKSK